MAFNGPLSTSNLSAAVYDLATAWKMDAEYLYAGTPISNQYEQARATTYFVKELKRASWFTMIPVLLKQNTGTSGFGQTFSYSVPRGTDYMLNVWLQCIVPAVTLLPGNQFGVNGRLRWTRKFMHNLIEEVDLSASDTQIATIDNYILDLSYQFMMESQNKAAYEDMIGDVVEMTGPHAAGLTLGATIPSRECHLPLPFFFTRDTGLALPTAALQFNDLTFNIKMRDWNQLLILDNSGVAGSGTVARAVPVVPTDIATAPILGNVQMWGEFALLNPIERNQVICTKRDMIIEKYQSANRSAFQPNSGSSAIFEPKFIFSVRALMMAMRNKTFANEWSNYSTASPVDNGGNDVDFSPSGAAPVVGNLTLTYETTNRFNQMAWSYFSKITPFYHAPATPAEIGYGLLSYALDLDNINPNGSTNYSRIATVQVQPNPSAQAIIAANGTGAAFSGVDYPQLFEFIIIALSYYALRVQDGQVSFVFFS